MPVPPATPPAGAPAGAPPAAPPPIVPHPDFTSKSWGFSKGGRHLYLCWPVLTVTRKGRAEPRVLAIAGSGGAGFIFLCDPDGTMRRVVKAADVASVLLSRVARPAGPGGEDEPIMRQLVDEMADLVRSVTQPSRPPPTGEVLLRFAADAREPAMLLQLLPDPRCTPAPESCDKLLAVLEALVTPLHAEWPTDSLHARARAAGELRKPAGYEVPREKMQRWARERKAEAAITAAAPAAAAGGGSAPAAPGDGGGDAGGGAHPHQHAAAAGPYPHAGATRGSAGAYAGPVAGGAAAGPAAGEVRGRPTGKTSVLVTIRHPREKCPRCGQRAPDPASLMPM